jgi:hypothetical protein
MSTPDQQNTLPADQEGMQIDENQQEEVEEEPTDKTGPQEKDGHDAAALDARASVARSRTRHCIRGAASADQFNAICFKNYAGKRKDDPSEPRAVRAVSAAEDASMSRSPASTYGCTTTRPRTRTGRS